MIHDRDVTRIAHRDLRNNSSDVLRRVASGETMEITNHGDVVAIISPAGAESVPRARIRKATIRGRFDEIEAAPNQHTTEELMDYLRGDR
jgi:prevent-host-death family protein